MRHLTEKTIGITLLLLGSLVLMLWACSPGEGHSPTVDVVVPTDLDFPPSPLALMEQAQTLATARKR